MSRKLLAVILLISVAAAGYAQKNKRKHKQDDTTINAVDSNVDYKSIGAPMPPIYFAMNDGSKIRNKDLGKKKNTLIMLFNPTCEHCQYQTNEFEKNLGMLKDVNFLLIAAPGMKEYLPTFESFTHVSKYPSLRMGLDSCGYIEHVFTYTALPQINIYDRDNKLMKVFTGEVALDSFKQYVD